MIDPSTGRLTAGTPEDPREALRKFAEYQQYSARRWRAAATKVAPGPVREALDAYADIAETVAHAFEEAADEGSAEPVTDLMAASANWLLDRQAFRPVEEELGTDLMKLVDDGCPHTDPDHEE